jgi:hypothetical protein
VTEEEAKRKRCCGPDQCGEVPFGGDLDKRYCIGEQCMAWRYALIANDSGYCGLVRKP